MTLDEGPPGWTFPALSSLAVLSTWIAAAFGAPSADAFLTNHGGHVIAWMATTMGPWLAYKGWKYHADSTVAKAQVDAGVPVTPPPAAEAAEGEVAK